CARWIGYFDFW
nr:immunoglobulin heavy chain junction region [Mus musculus]MBK4185665.1 immunoglobulin heavy chain junction region [Mus musculus]MBK4185666.1 immunoglobulin heavy chain junction region [Mus musculus]MBK4185668.1 immunoglobulin heavy chain junction region [Mus musculus]MBK4185669.1 immunoglobulin heavy chain junction region [Mus musculus]